jgi:hypothetical protein
MLEELTKEFDLTCWSTCTTVNGKSYTYMDPLGINVIFNEWDQSFELKWMIPKSIFTIECPPCSPYTNIEHFRRIYLKFWRMIREWHCHMPDRYVREFEDVNL